MWVQFTLDNGDKITFNSKELGAIQMYENETIFTFADSQRNNIKIKSKINRVQHTSKGPADLDFFNKNKDK